MECERCGQELRIQTEGVHAGEFVHFWSNQFRSIRCPYPLRTKAKPRRQVSNDF